jgi:hypothetical protein
VPVFLFVFREPVDPEKENLPDYRSKIERPMDLGTIQKRLTVNLFSSLEEWKNDVRLVWRNAIKYNDRECFIGTFALEMTEIFDGYLVEMPENEIGQWMNRIRKSQKTLEQYLQMHVPQPAWHSKN